MILSKKPLVPTSFPFKLPNPSSPPKTTAALPRFKSPAHQTLHSLLQRCPSPKQLKQLHAQLTTTGLLRETLTAAALIAFSSLSDPPDLPYARKLFDQFPHPNKFMHNTLIRAYSNTVHPLEALSLFRHMMGRGLLPNNFTLPFVLKACAVESAFKSAILIHGLIFKLGYGSQVFVMNALLHAYTACGSVGMAFQLFDEIPDKNVVSWNSMIDGFSQVGDCERAVSLFRTMRDSDMEPDEFTLVSLLCVCLQTGNLDLGRVVHNYIVVSGIGIDLIMGNALVDMYGKCGELWLAQACFDRMPTRNVVTWTSLVCAHAKHGLVDLARDWFNQMPERSIVSWNAMLSCYVRHGLCQEGLVLYDHMQASRMVPDEATLVSVLSACSQNGNLMLGKKTHDYTCENIVNPSVVLLNSIVDMYAKCGRIDVALGLFSTMNRKNVVSWNVIIGGLAIHGRGLDAVELFRNMVGSSFCPDGITFIGLLSACGHGGLLEVGQHYFEAMDPVYKVPREIEHYACMVDLLGRGGHLAKAVELIRNMPMKPDVVIWGALLGACRIHGNVGIGQQIVKHLLESEPYNGGLYVLVSNMLCESQRWHDVKNLWKLMKERGIRKGKATSLVEINSVTHEFIVGDTRHEKSSDIYLLLDGLTDNMVSVGCLSKPLEHFWM